MRHSLIQRLRAALARFAGDARGNIAMLFGLTMPILVLMTVGGVDIHRASTVRVNLQDALDAAALAAARSNATNSSQVQQIGMSALQANLQAYPEITLKTATFTLNSDNVVIADGKVDVKALVANIFLPPYGKFMDDQLPVAAHSEVNRASRNIEVSLVLDATGSMAGQKIVDLRAAAKELVDIVVQDQQTPWYSKVAIVPYSMAVNVDSYADAARGTIIGSRNISSISWATGSAKTVSSISRANWATVTASNHGFQNGDKVVIWGASGMSQVNDRVFTVANRTNNSFQLANTDSRYWSNFSGSAKVQECARSDCAPTVTASNHGLPNGGYVYLTDVGGMTQLNDQTFQAAVVDSNTFRLDTVGSRVYSNNTGKSWCAQAGCTWYAFTNVYGDLVTQEVSTCVTDRSGGNAYTDASPSSARLGRNYPSTSNPCLSAKFAPLSADRSTIKSSIDALQAGGSTGGHIGVAWGWYALSPNFSSLLGSRAGAAYNSAETLKAAVIMTDGEYNSGYCNGVISADSTNGSGSTALHINCNSPNGHPFDQSLRLCEAMKAAGIIVYTVGFQVVDDPRARAIVNDCATSSANVYMADSGADLKEAFAAIGRDVTKLRISK